MDNLVKQAYLTPENASQNLSTLQRVIKIGTEFKCRKAVFSSHEKDDAHFERIMDTLFEPKLPVSGMDMTKLLDFVETEIVPLSTNFAAPMAMAFPDAGNSIAGISGDILSVLLNQNLINWLPCSPAATVIEMTVINWLRGLVGYPTESKIRSPADVGGIVTSGGVASNTIALLLAREKAMPNCSKTGIRGSSVQSPCVIVPNGIDHYSSRLSAGWLGIGENNVVKAPTVNFKYDLAMLVDLIDSLKGEGKTPVLLVCYAGDSRSMTCDDFKSIRKICDDHSIWMHVDGCHGTQLVFSDTHRQQKLSGIELSDSITLDPHKVLNVPYAVSLLLVRDIRVMESVRRPEDIITGEKHSFGQLTPFFGSRAFASLKLYMMIKNLGGKNLATVIETRCKLAKHLAAEIKRRVDLCLVNKDVDINSVIFMYCPLPVRDFITKCSEGDRSSLLAMINETNLAIQKSLLNSGDVWLHTFAIPDLSNSLGINTDQPVMLQPLRFMSGNPILKTSHLQLMLERVTTIGRKEFEFVCNKYIQTRNCVNIEKLLINWRQALPNNLISLAKQSNLNERNDDPKSFSEVKINTDLNNNKENDLKMSFRNDISIRTNESCFLSFEDYCFRKSEMMVALRLFCSKEFRNAKGSYFLVIYGSYAYSFVKASSDLDVFIAADNNLCSTERRNRVISFITELHKKYGMARDDEVPADKKTLVPYSFLIKSCEGRGIIREGTSGGPDGVKTVWTFPKISKTKEYLSSDELLHRFFLGMLANPTIFVAGDSKMFKRFRGLASRNLVRGVMASYNRTVVSSCSLIRDFCCSPKGDYADHYLGFAYKEPFKSYLLQFLEETLSEMNFDEFPGEYGQMYKVREGSLQQEMFE